MNIAGIDDGDLVLVREQPNASEGDMVVALLDDEATVKQFHRSHNIVVLRPRSRNKNHKPIILTSDFQIQGIVVGTISTREKKLL
jgi:repressor LexA